MSPSGSSHPECRDAESARRLPHGVFTVRLTGAGRARFDDASPVLASLFGLAEGVLPGDGAAALAAIHPDDLPDLLAAATRARDTGHPLGWEGRVVTGAGERWLRVETGPATAIGADLVWHGVASDITERRLAQAHFADSEEMYRQLAIVAPSPITLVDVHGLLRITNPRALHLFGVADEKSAIGRSMFDWVAPGSRAAARELFAELLEASHIVNLELEFLRENGSPFAGEASAAVVRDAHGAPRFVIIVIMDLTQRLHQEQERLKLQKLEAVGALAGGLAHDFNNLLQGVFGYISLARASADDPAAVVEMLGRAEQALGPAVSLTTQLLTFAKGGKPNKRPLALPPVVDNAAHFATSGSSTICTFLRDDDLWDADADEGQVAQVVQNIVLNASQAMGGAGIVHVELRNVEVPRGEDAALPNGGRFVVIRVTDTGCGIPDRELERIFDPYFTTKAQGSGLGLATSWSIAKRHGGTIRVDSAPGRGSCFEVFLPATGNASPAGAEAGPVAAVAAAHPRTRRRRVLVMDDEELVRSVATAMVGSLGHRVDVAVDGAEAIALVEQAQAAGDAYDLVILDLTVRGGMGGAEAVGQIRALSPGARVVVSSGYSDSAVIADHRRHGFDACLNKPYTMEALRATLTA